jgi:hypothetical protein
MRALRNWRTWYCGAIWALQCTAYYGIVFWMPMLIGQARSTLTLTHNP